MRCNICDKALSDKEISYNEELGAYEPCTFCLEAAMDAAYSDGFQHEDDENVTLVGEEAFDDLVDPFLPLQLGYRASIMQNSEDEEGLGG